MSSLNSWLETLFLKTNPLYLVQDNDHILSNLEIQMLLLEYDLYFHKDPMELRYVFEQYRLNLFKKPLLLIITKEFSSVPFDILKSSLQVSISWGLLFPFLNKEALKKFSSEELNRLLTRSEREVKVQSILSFKETELYLFQSVYEINLSDMTNTEQSFLGKTAEFYTNGHTIPKSFIDFIKRYYSEIDLLYLLQSKDLFKNYLNHCFSQDILRYEDLTIDIQKKNSSSQLEFYASSVITPLIEKVHVKDLSVFPSAIRPLLIEHQQIQDSLIHQLESLNFDEFRLEDWKKLAFKIGKIRSNNLLFNTNFNDTQSILIANNAFEDWFVKSFESLRSLPSFPSPKLSHQVPHYLASSKNYKKALLVMDGMSFTFWEIIKSYLIKNTEWDFEENAIFSWVPTLTSVSRQAIFSGLEPREFSNSIYTTNYEATLWQAFWVKDGYKGEEITYQRSLGFEEYKRSLINSFSSPVVSIYGGVIDVIDRFIHSSLQGLNSIYYELDHWLNQNYLVNLLNDLYEANYDIYITSDHGHIEAFGIGKINEGALSSSKGQRVRMYENSSLQNNAHTNHPNTIVWESTGLPNINPVIAKGQDAFIRKNDKIITHGGINIEEVIVPFIHLKRN